MVHALDWQPFSAVEGNDDHLATGPTTVAVFGENQLPVRFAPA